MWWHTSGYDLADLSTPDVHEKTALEHEQSAGRSVVLQNSGSGKSMVLKIAAYGFKGKSKYTKMEKWDYGPPVCDNTLCGQRFAAALITRVGIKQCRNTCIASADNPHSNPWHWCTGDHGYPPAVGYDDDDDNHG